MHMSVRMWQSVWCNIILMENLGKITLICKNIPYQNFALCAYAYVCTYMEVNSSKIPPLFFYYRPKIKIMQYANL